MTMPTPVVVPDLDDDEDHDCEDYISNTDTTCERCGEVLDPRDLACCICGFYPCHCDDAYEARKDDMMERGY